MSDALDAEEGFRFADAWPPERVASPAGNPRSPLSGKARQLLLELVAEARADWTRAGDILARALRDQRGLPAWARRQLADDFYTIVRFDLRLSAIVDELLARRRGLRIEPTPAERDELLLMVNDLVAGAAAADVLPVLEARLGLRSGTLRPEWVLGPDAGLGRKRGPERVARALGFPAWIAERLISDHGAARARAVLRALNRRAPICLLVNPARADRATLIERLLREGVAARPSPLSPLGVELEAHHNVFGLSAYTEGACDIMDEGSQLVALAVDARPDARVLDACAGAGGKTLALSIAMAGRGTILAMDTAGKKLEEARSRLRRLGYSNVRARAIEDGGARLPDEARLHGWDRVLVDAPCTALGTLRRHPELRHVLDPEVVRAHANQQLGLLATYAPLVAPGGRLVYATCTLFNEENQDVVARFLNERRDFRPLPLTRVLGQERALALGDGQTLQLLPGVHGTDGFFAAVLERIG